MFVIRFNSFIKYDEAEIIRDRARFERLSKDWKTLGGSSAQ